MITWLISPCQLLHRFPFDFDNFISCTHFTYSRRTLSVNLLDLPGALPGLLGPSRDLPDLHGKGNAAPEIMKKMLRIDNNSAESIPETPQIWTDEVSERTSPSLHQHYM